MSVKILLTFFSNVSFLGYGISYFYSPHMKNEFKRFSLDKFGILTAGLEIIGAIGLLVGLLYTSILLISSAGLAVLMLLALLARIRVKDSIWVSLLAFLFMVLHACIFYLTQ